MKPFLPTIPSGPRGGSAMRFAARPLWALALALAALLAAACSPPKPVAPLPPLVEYGQLDKAAATVRAMRAANATSAVNGLLPKAWGALIFPRIADAALVFGGASGDGVLAVRGDDGAWSAPAFYRYTAANAGLVIGATENQVLMLIMDKDTARRFSGMTLDLGGSVRQIDGARLTQHEATLNQAIDGIVTFALGDGFWAGLTVQAAYVSPKSDALRRLYGQNATVADVLFTDRWPRPQQAAPLYEALGPAGPEFAQPSRQ